MHPPTKKECILNAELGVKIDGSIGVRARRVLGGAGVMPLLASRFYKPAGGAAGC
jgi:hypothetical protein